MDNQPNELRKKLTPEVREKILRDNWQSHDARWFLKISQEFGFKVANKMNKLTLASMAKTDMKRIIQATECTKITTVGDIVMLFEIALDLYFPPPMLDYEIRTIANDALLFTVKLCPTFEEIKKAGAVGAYECTCAVRIDSWLKACGFNGKAKIQKSMMQGDSFCEALLSSITRETNG